jgi:hypothetical protein
MPLTESDELMSHRLYVNHDHPLVIGNIPLRNVIFYRSLKK